jgi:cytochrome oxidase assembly protein ShyY1
MTADSPFPGDAVGRPVRFQGRWLPDETLFVKDRLLHGRRGYWVVTPVAVCTSSCAPGNPAMLVVRGWSRTPAGGPAAPPGRVSLPGWLQPAEGGGVPDQNPADRVLPQMQVVDAIPHVRQDLYSGYVIAENPPQATPSGPLRPVTPASLPQPGGLTSLRNLAYAFQWWIFGGFAVFLWWRMCSDEVKRLNEREDALLLGEDADAEAGTAEEDRDDAVDAQPEGGTAPRGVEHGEVPSKS